MNRHAHTPGPWRVDIDSPFVIAAGNGYSVCETTPGNPFDVSNDEAQANARRIVACVNALERISTEALERTVKAGGRSLIAEIEAEREAQAQRNANPQRPPTKRERFTDAIRAFLTRSTDRRDWQ